VSKASAILCVGLVFLAFSAFGPFSFGTEYQDISALILLSLLPTALGLVMCTIAYAIDYGSRPRSRRFLLVPGILIFLWGVFLCWGGYFGYIERSGLLRTSTDQAERNMWATQLAGQQIQIIDGILFLIAGLLLFFYSRISE
jgi:hypothetical protein